MDVCSETVKVVDAEAVPISTFTAFGEREFLVADERGFDYLVYKMAEDFLLTSEGKILDTRLKLNHVRNVACFLILTFYLTVVNDKCLENRQVFAKHNLSENL